jgi:cytochrome c oxidase subunit 4
MSAGTVEEIRKHVKVYITVFVTLMVLTIVTVGVSYLDLAVPLAITLALIIATVKGSLVASYFMHLVSEKSPIFWALMLTAFFFIVLMFLPLLTMLDTPATR